MLKDIRVSNAPHISKPMSTRSVMLDIIIGLAPAVAAAGYYFRLYGLLLVGMCMVWCVATEWLCNAIRRKPNSLGDLSAVVTGIILALSLPPSLPLWAAAVGSIISIAIGKMVFGGLGANIFNPAMIGRTFLTASFGALMTTWTIPATIDRDMSPISQQDITVEGITQATPLAWSKMAIKDANGARVYNNWNFRGTLTGNIGGCLGETSAIALFIGGLYLLIRRTTSVHIPLAVLLSAFIFAAVPYMVEVVSNIISERASQPFEMSLLGVFRTQKFIQPFYHLTSGAMLIGAFFIATDPVTAPLTRRGMWLFGAGVGTITMLIRIVGAYPEGMMFAVLLMNAVTPLIDRLFRCVPAGGKPSA